MQNQEFNKMFDLASEFAGEKVKYAKLDLLPMNVKVQFDGMTKEEQLEVIKKNEEEMPKELHEEIQAFVTAERKKNKPIREIKRMVKRKFGIIVL